MKNEAWKNLEAVKQNRVVILPPDLFDLILVQKLQKQWTLCIKVYKM